MAKPIGRIWINENCMSGYLIVQVSDEFEPVVCKFGCSLKNNPTWLYPPKEKHEVLEDGHDGVVETELLQTLSPEPSN
ncbi:MAG: hypothetical protein KKB51_02920 [Candidatus Riflebacteria bacterium]|nr:hypothetical protein [Candidatus Riflebacteria bacterium]